MQRFGPPPSYRNLKIPGLNAPLPPGATYGYAEGQWGKPPVDHLGVPLYGDPFGVAPDVVTAPTPVSDVSPWGELIEEVEEEGHESEEVEMEQDEEEVPVDETSGVESVASSVISGMVTPDTFDLRKGISSETPEVDLRKPKQLYQVLEQQEASVGNALYGSSHTYKIPTASSASAAVASHLTDGRVDVTISADELATMDDAALARKYDEQMEAVKALRSTEDVSDIVLEEMRKRKRKEELKSKSKKFKDFKF